MAHNGFFQDRYGNNSSSRLLGFIVVLYALGLATTVLVLGCTVPGTSVIVAAAAAGTIFTTIAGPALIYMFSNKRNEASTNVPIESK